MSTETENTNKFHYRVVPRYGTYLEDDKVILQVALPGVQKEDIEMKALNDFFTLKAHQGDTLYTLDIDFGVKIEPNNTKSHYEEGLLRVEFKRYNPLEHAFEVPIL
jgi:HSP20 family molecular chaperone IbpA